MFNLCSGNDVMKAILVREFGPVGLAKLEEIADPIPSETEVTVEIAAVAANFVDCLVLEGKYQFLPERPFIPGKLPCGIVRAVGSGVTTLRPGDRVLTMAEQGGYAEWITVPAAQCIVLPEKITFDEAASVALAYDTAWVALRERALVGSGDRVLILGASGAVGLAAVQLAKVKGATVLAAISSPDKAELVRQAGADRVLDLRVPDLRNELRRQVYSVTDGIGVEIVLDTLGGDYFDAAVRALAWRGKLVVIGFASGRIPQIKANYLLLKNITIAGLQVSDYRKRMPNLIRECYADVFDYLERNLITPPPINVFGLSDYHCALRLLTERQLKGRAILHPNDTK